MHIVINDIPPSNNEFMGNSHNYNIYRRIKEQWHWNVKASINPAEKPEKPYQQAIVFIKYYFKDRIRRDPDNYSGKMILDPLVREGILADDSFKCVKLLLGADVDKDNPRTEVFIRGL